MPRVNLDADVLADAVLGRLSARDAALVGDAEVVVSPMAVRKLASAIRRGRVTGLALDDPRLDELVNRSDLVQITPEIAALATQLGMDSGPADEIIAATSIALDAPLLTRDEGLIATDEVPTVSSGA